MRPTDDERREVAARIRALREHAWDESSVFDLLGCAVEECGLDDTDQLFAHIADLIEPEERTCHIEPLSLHEFFAGEKYILSSDARESAEDERFDRLSRELEEGAHFTCSSCHALFGTREVANADYDILEDGTYEVSGVAPIIKFCPYCGARVVQR